MEPLLYLTHRIPYPPNKGDKVRSFHILRYLASRYRIYLGSFVDQPEDWGHAERLKEFCAGVKLLPVHPMRARFKSLLGFATGAPLTLHYYRNAELRAWVEQIVEAERIGKAVVFCSAMAQYVEGLRTLKRVVDFVDVDSQKWLQYAHQRTWPMSAVYKREARCLLQYERQVAAWSDQSFLVTRAEADLFKSVAPEVAHRTGYFNNGVDTEFFSPRHALTSPYDSNEWPLCFTGAMDYWPNIDAVVWFAKEVFPAIRTQRPSASFHIVGMNPAPAVRALAVLPGIKVSGAVPDIRPYLKYAAVVVVPLRVARGIQNKVLEAMAMAKAVVISEGAAEGLAGRDGQEFLVAKSASDYVSEILALGEEARSAVLGAAARISVLEHYNWDKNLQVLGEALVTAAVPTEHAGRCEGALFST
ncbi:MAG: TIGR03087 family PEP-CTERM/XrtA system glycosyltransferase [Burkholderiales bacterium]